MARGGATTKVKVIRREEQKVPIHEVTLKELRTRLKRYERKYGFTSAEFYEKFKRGEIEDTKDTVDWYIEYRVYLRAKGERGRILKAAVEATRGFYLPIMVASLEKDRQGRQREPDTFLVTEEDLKRLQETCVEKIRQAAQSDALKPIRRWCASSVSSLDFSNNPHLKEWVIM
ncbi:MAG: hypothetical protein HY314_01840 [Acidobacteria bacterium]|nr:hypothetical protein [Acidobacteriota bacterium]